MSFLRKRLGLGLGFALFLAIIHVNNVFKAGHISVDDNDNMGEPREIPVVHSYGNISLPSTNATAITSREIPVVHSYGNISLPSTNATAITSREIPVVYSYGNISLPSTNATAITIVVQLSGEMGNQLSKMAAGFGVQLLAKEKYGINATVRLRHQDHSKWKRAMTSTKACFPNTRHFDFEECNTEQFNELNKNQNELFGNESALLNMQCGLENCIDDSLSFFQKALQQSELLDRKSNYTIAIPYLQVAFFANSNSFVLDRYYERLRKLFTFDNALCKALPEPDESVFHVRNFLLEMPRVGKRLGFEELSPNKTASELFSHLQAGDKVAITSRMPESVGEYVAALEARGLVVRVIKEQSQGADFCFLLKAQKELIAPARSTFSSWAGMLGDAKKVTLYSVDSPHTRKSGDPFVNYNYTNEKLRSRISFQLFMSEASERK